MNEIYDYVEGGYRIFPLHPIVNCRCGCGDASCDAIGKHPAVASWQHTPEWSDEQLENIDRHMIVTGYGVLVGQRLIVDVDPRNGGREGYEKLCADLSLDLIQESGFVVDTGGGGWHIYFTRPEGSFAQSLPEYPGVDFKTTGFVVGEGSLHASGVRYERKKGNPQDTTESPEALLELLRRKQMTRATVNGLDVDVSMQDLRDMLGCYTNTNLHYDDWLAVGMAIHHSTQGCAEGYALWEQWSATCDKHNAARMDKRWQSFGKSHNPITLGTLIHLAEQHGYERPITFPVTQPIEQPSANDSTLPVDVSHLDPLMPPGLTGKIAAWIDRQGYYPRQRLACMAAITAVGNAAGLFWREDITNVTLNLMSLCVAGSGTGKESVQEAFLQIMQAAGLAACVHGDIKSKQEITRNLIEHQAAFYLTDEIGEILRTIESAKKRGGAVYLEGVTGDLLKIFTKAHSVLPVSGDVRRDMLADLGRKITQISDLLDKGEKEKKATLQPRLDATKKLLEQIRAGGGLPRPFLSMLGFTTLDSLEPALSVEMAKNGFLNRAFIIEERETNPKPNPRFSPSDFPYTLEMASIATAGDYDSLGSDRVEYLGEPRHIRTEEPAKNLLKLLRDWQWHFAEHHKLTTGYEALARRAHEFISKISAILAVADGGIRTAEHVKWAAAFIKWDIDEKIRLIQYVDANSTTSTDTLATGLESRILSVCQEPQYMSVITQRLLKRKGVTRETVAQLVTGMLAAGLLAQEGKKYVSVSH